MSAAWNTSASSGRPHAEERTIDIVTDDREIGVGGSASLQTSAWLHVGSLRGAHRLIRRTGGRARLPAVRKDIAAGRLLRLLEPHEAFDRSLYAVHPRSRYLPAKLRTFLDYRIDHFGPER